MSGLCQVIPKMQPWAPWCPVWTLTPSSPTNPIEGIHNPMGTPCSRATRHPMTQTLLTRQHQCPEQGQLLQQVPHAEPVVPSRRARPWLLPCLAWLSGCPAAGGTGRWMVPGAEGEGCWHQRAAPTPLFRHPHVQGRGDGQAQLVLPAPGVSAHYLEPGHPTTGIGHREQPSLPCCSAVPVMLLREAGSPQQGPQGTQ